MLCSNRSYVNHRSYVNLFTISIMLIFCAESMDSGGGLVVVGRYKYIYLAFGCFAD